MWGLPNFKAVFIIRLFQGQFTASLLVLLLPGPSNFYRVRVTIFFFEAFSFLLLQRNWSRPFTTERRIISLAYFLDLVDTLIKIYSEA